MSSIDLSVVIPAFNEAQRIEASLLVIVEFLARRAEGWEVIVADDGSTDGTSDIVRRLAARYPAVKLVVLARNRGKGAALRAGVAATSGRRVLITDADLSTPMSELAKLERALDDGADAVLGSRATNGAEVRRPQSPLRVWLGRGGNLLIQLVAAPGFQDTQCGFKLFDGDLGRRLFALSRENRFAIDIELVAIARRVFGARLAEVGVLWEHRDGSSVRPIDYLDTLVALPRIAMSVKKNGIAEHGAADRL